MIDEDIFTEYLCEWSKGSTAPWDEPYEKVFLAGWEACIQYEKDQLAKSLAEFDNDDNDCGDACKL